MTFKTLRIAAMSALALSPALPVAGGLAAIAIATPAFAAQKAVTPLNLKDGVAVKGYDPVAYFTDGKPLKGDAAYTAAYQGATYRFASAAHRDAFKAEPARYAPQYGGYCAFAISGNTIADISPGQWAVVNNKLYLNNNVLAQGLWSRDKDGHIVKGDKNWAAYPKAGS